jgi:hypothetical protein
MSELERDLHTLPGLRDEHEDVIAWRTQQLLAYGLSAWRADRVARTDVDLHDLADLVAAGCPIRLALRVAPDPMHRPRLKAAPRRSAWAA